MLGLIGFIFNIIGFIFSIFGLLISCINKSRWGVLLFIFLLGVNTIIGIMNGKMYFNNEYIKEPTIKDLNEGKAHIDTTYTTHKGVTDTTYQIVWND